MKVLKFGGTSVGSVKSIGNPLSLSSVLLGASLINLLLHHDSPSAVRMSGALVLSRWWTAITR